MNKWIRWKGLIGFVVAVVVLLLFFILFIDSIIKNSIEFAGTRMVGAEVGLDSAEFRFSPLGMTLGRLQVTNPEQPLRNIVDIQHIGFNLDGLNLLRRKVLINEMRVDGVRLNTPRKTSGALKRKARPAKPKGPQKDTGKGFTLPDITIPNANKILDREELKTIKQAESFKTNIKTSRQDWDKIKQAMPGEQRLNEYNKRLDKIKQTNIKDVIQLSAAVKELKQIKKEVKADINTIDSSRKQISGDLSNLNTELKALKASPEQEYQRLVNKYSASTRGISNISHLLFGGEARKYTSMALAWYKKIEPWLAYVDFTGEQAPAIDRYQGVDVRFREYHPSPNFLIKHIRASVVTQQGSFSGKILDVTNEQDITRRPTTLSFSGDKMKGIGSILVTGTFNHIKPDEVKDRLNFKMTDYQLNNYRLIDKDDMRIYLDKAKSDINLVARRQNNKIMADFKSHIHAINYNNQASGNELAMMFLASINKTRDFYIYGKLRGTFDDYSIQVSSDLDNRLKANMKQHMDRRLAGFRKQLKDEIYLRTRQPIQEAEANLKDLKSTVKNDIAIRKARLDQQLNAIQADIRQKEQQIKAKSDTKKRELENKLKDKLKKLF